MRIVTLLIFSIIATSSILILKYYLNDPNKSVKENISSTFSNSTRLLQLYSTDIENLNNAYTDLSCYLFDTQMTTGQDSDTIIDRLRIIFQKQAELSNALSNVTLNKLNKTQSEEEVAKIINYIIKILAPFLLVFIIILLGWFTCCSCCCYRYCPIVCKRKVPHTSTSRLIPVLLVLFTGCSLIIPSILAYVKFENFKKSSTEFYCKLINLNYVLLNGSRINQTDTFEWIGFNVENYLDTLSNNYQWLDIDTSNSIGKTEEIYNNYSKFIEHFDSYYLKAKEFKYFQILNPSITNHDLSDRKIPEFFKKLEFQNNTSFIYFMKDYSDNNLKRFIDIIENIRIKYESLSENREKLTEIFKQLQINMNISKDLKDITNNILNIFKEIITGNYSKTVNLVGVMLFAIQLIVGLLDIGSSILILTNVKEGYVKYLGHTSWCFSTFSLTIMAIILLVIYALGSAVCNLGFILSEKIKNPDMNDASYIQCFNEFNLTKVYDDIKTDNFVLKDLDNFTQALYTYNDFMDSFDIMDLFIYLKELQNEINDHTITVIGDDYKYTYKESEAVLNKITDFRDDIAYMIMNDCGFPPSIQIKEKTSDCTFPLFDLSQSTLPSYLKNKCLKLSSISQKYISDIFETVLSNCKYTSGKYLDANFSTLYEQLSTIHYILQNYLEEYYEFRSFVNGEILNEYDKFLIKFSAGFEYINFYNLLSNWIQNINVFIAEINNTLKFKLNMTFQDTTKFINFSQYVHCCNISFLIILAFYSNFMKEIIQKMNFDLLNGIYAVIVCYLISMIFNSLSSIFGLTSNMINNSFITKSKIE